MNIRDEQGLESLTVNKLKKMLKQAIEKEDYEHASEIRDELNRRKKE